MPEHLLKMTNILGMFYLHCQHKACVSINVYSAINSWYLWSMGFVVWDLSTKFVVSIRNALHCSKICSPSSNITAKGTQEFMCGGLKECCENDPNFISQIIIADNIYGYNLETRQKSSYLKSPRQKKCASSWQHKIIVDLVFWHQRVSHK